ncbi:transposon Ty3-I Gag-Pol polyprotein, partial [Trichonephila clavipes]
ECQRRKSVPQRPPGRLVPIPPAIAPFHRIGIDLLGRFPKSAHGNKWIIVCTDYSTRYAITKALPTAEVDEIAKFLLEEIVLRHGAPRVIITDRGAVFRSRLVSSLVDLCNIDHRFTTAYHPQTNGLTERFNKTLADMLSMYVDQPEPKNHDKQPECTILRAQDKKIVDVTIPNTKWYPTLPEISYGFILPVRKVGLSEKLLRRYFGTVSGATPFISRDYEVQDFDPASRKRKLREVVHVLRMKPYHDPAELNRNRGYSPKESYKGTHHSFQNKDP